MNGSPSDAAAVPSSENPRVRGLRDVVCEQPRLLLVGINPGLRSGALGHHFAGRGNPFWRLLHAAGLTPELLPPERDRELARFGIALTNLCPRTTRTAAELGADELAAGRRALLRKCARLRPAVVGLVGLTVYDVLFAGRGPRGPGRKPETLAGARLFVVPNPSGLNAAYPGFQHKLVWYRRLRAFVDAAAPASVDAAAPVSVGAVKRAPSRARGTSAGRS